uniref:Nuclear receptor corepressor 1-like n=1 Tax=Saccoglossus kowalevskii TaxID=10224 RepID=A0ABM0MFP0_SACKO|nr:PREDICTED: nuclear receptor corepressor 1-like [Saccoglossus kowalevskii]
MMKEFKEKQLLNVWTDPEKQIFKEKYIQFPKNFQMIASFLERKSVPDCVLFYYLTKKNENYKQSVRKTAIKKRGFRKGRNDDDKDDKYYDEHDKDKHDMDDEEHGNPSHEVDVGMPVDGTACSLCKNPLDAYTLSRPVNKSNCDMFGVRENEVTPNMRVCSSCRCRSFRRRYDQKCMYRLNLMDLQLITRGSRRDSAADSVASTVTGASDEEDSSVSSDDNDADNDEESSDTASASENENDQASSSSKPVELTQASSSSKPDEPSHASSSSKPDELSQASSSNKPVELSQASSSSKPDELSQASSSSQPDELSQASSSSKPVELSQASSSSKPAEISPPAADSAAVATAEPTSDLAVEDVTSASGVGEDGEVTKEVENKEISKEETEEITTGESSQVDTFEEQRREIDTLPSQSEIKAALEKNDESDHDSSATCSADEGTGHTEGVVGSTKKENDGNKEEKHRWKNPRHRP